MPEAKKTVRKPSAYNIHMANVGQAQSGCQERQQGVRPRMLSLLTLPHGHQPKKS
jgi:hypothetical protein